MDREPALDGVRGIAISLVMAAHAFYGRLQGGFIGVDVFFVLSGFLITGVLRRDGMTLGKFYARRARRLLPAVLIALVLAGVLWDGPGFWSAVAPVSLYYANIIAALDPHRLGTLLHTWSLSTEEQFYLLWPVTLIVMGRLKVLRWTVIAAASACFALLTAVFHGRLPAAFGYFSPLTKIAALLLGSALSLMPRRPSAPVLGWMFLGSLPFLARLMSEQSPVYYQLGAPLVWIGAAGLICEATRPSPIKRLLSLKPLTWIGERSYGLYLYHFPIFLAFERWRTPHSAANFAAITAARIVAAVLLAHLSYAFVERPILAVRRDS